MTEEERKDLSRYFRLSDYRDSEYFLQEEYDELQEVIKRSPIAQELEELRYQWIIGKISEMSYMDQRMAYFTQMCEERKKQNNPVKQLSNKDKNSH